MTVMMCVFKFNCLWGYFSQEVIVADVLIRFMPAESKTDTETRVYLVIECCHVDEPTILSCGASPKPLGWFEEVCEQVWNWT